METFSDNDILTVKPFSLLKEEKQLIIRVSKAMIISGDFQIYKGFCEAHNLVKSDVTNC